MNKKIAEVFTEDVRNECENIKKEYNANSEIAEQEFYNIVKERLIKKLKRKRIKNPFTIKLPKKVMGIEVKCAWVAALYDFLDKEMDLKISIYLNNSKLGITIK